MNRLISILVIGLLFITCQEEQQPIKPLVKKTNSVDSLDSTAMKVNDDPLVATGKGRP